jgi:hypothetical protein
MTIQLCRNCARASAGHWTRVQNKLAWLHESAYQRNARVRSAALASLAAFRTSSETERLSAFTARGARALSLCSIFARVAKRCNRARHHGSNSPMRDVVTQAFRGTKTVKNYACLPGQHAPIFCSAALACGSAVEGVTDRSVVDFAESCNASSKQALQPTAAPPRICAASVLENHVDSLPEARQRWVQQHSPTRTRLCNGLCSRNAGIPPKVGATRPDH